MGNVIINGINFITVPDTEISGGEYIQVRKHKKKRINKKYLKKYGKIYRAPDTIFGFNNAICCAESRLKEIIAKIENDNKLIQILQLSQSKPFDGLLTRKEMMSK